MSSLVRSIIDFNGFYAQIEAAIDEKAIYATKLIKEADKPYIVPEILSWLIRRTETIGIMGYLKEGVLETFFDKEVMEEFDDLYIDFREYLRNEKGIEPNDVMTLLRHRDNHTFIPLEGEPLDTLSNGQCSWPFEDSDPVGIESDPFLPSGRWVFTES